MKVFDRINAKIILRKHLNTFYDYGILTSNGQKKSTFSDFFTFLICPIVISLFMVFIGVRLTNEYINIIITTLSIFVGLLLNLLLLVLDLAKKQKVKNKEFELLNEIVPPIEKSKYTIVVELYANISFAILISIITIIVAIFPTLKPQLLLKILKELSFYSNIKYIYITLTNSAVIFFSIEFLFTLLMILKRFFLIFNKEINEE